MPKFTPKPESNWLIEVNAVDTDGRQIYTPNGKILKTKIQMEDATFADGTKQPLYFPSGHAKEGLFKGMQIIMEERGLPTEGLLAQCTGFKCPNRGTTNCCCRRTLFNQPDFVRVKSRLETYCNSRGVEVMFLPKFHCELNFIEQCWGYAKRIYRHYPASSREADLERNLLASLEAVPLKSMRKSVQLIDDSSYSVSSVIQFCFPRSQIHGGI
jgi:transposase